MEVPSPGILFRPRNVVAKLLTSGASAWAIFKVQVLFHVVAKGEPDFQRSENEGFFSNEMKLVTIKELSKREQVAKTHHPFP